MISIQQSQCEHAGDGDLVYAPELQFPDDGMGQQPDDGVEHQPRRGNVDLIRLEGKTVLRVLERLSPVMFHGSAVAQSDDDRDQKPDCRDDHTQLS